MHQTVTLSLVGSVEQTFAAPTGTNVRSFDETSTAATHQ